MSTFCDFLPDDPSCKVEEPEPDPVEIADEPVDPVEDGGDGDDPQPDDVNEKTGGAEVCDPALEDCETRPTEDVYETGSSTAALLLGVFALLKFVVPLSLYFAVGSSSS